VKAIMMMKDILGSYGGLETESERDEATRAWETTQGDGCIQQWRGGQ